MDNDTFYSERDKDLENQGAQLHQKNSQGSGGGCKSCHHNHRVEYHVGLDDSFPLLEDVSIDNEYEF